VSGGGVERTTGSAVPARLTLTDAGEFVEGLLVAVAYEYGFELCLGSSGQLGIDCLAGAGPSSLETLGMPREEAMPLDHAWYGRHDGCCSCSARREVVVDDREEERFLLGGQSTLMAVLVTLLRIRHRVQHFGLTKLVHKHRSSAGCKTKATLQNAGPDRNVLAGGIGPHGLMFAKIANGEIGRYIHTNGVLPGIGCLRLDRLPHSPRRSGTLSLTTQTLWRGKMNFSLTAFETITTRDGLCL
jgi:hypothetical protein